MSDTIQGSSFIENASHQESKSFDRPPARLSARPPARPPARLPFTLPPARTPARPPARRPARPPVLPTVRPCVQHLPCYHCIIETKLTSSYLKTINSIYIQYQIVRHRPIRKQLIGIYKPAKAPVCEPGNSLARHPGRCLPSDGCQEYCTWPRTVTCLPGS